MAEATPTCARGDGTATPTASFHTNERRTVPVTEGLIFDLSRQTHGLRQRLVIFDELDLAAACSPIHHRGTGGDAEDELLIERGTDGGSWELADERLRGAKDPPTWTAHILT